MTATNEQDEGDDRSWRLLAVIASPSPPSDSHSAPLATARWLSGERLHDRLEVDVALDGGAVPHHSLN